MCVQIVVKIINPPYRLLSSGSLDDSDSETRSTIVWETSFTEVPVLEKTPEIGPTVSYYKYPGILFVNLDQDARGDGFDRFFIWGIAARCSSDDEYPVYNADSNIYTHQIQSTCLNFCIPLSYQLVGILEVTNIRMLYCTLVFHGLHRADGESLR